MLVAGGIASVLIAACSGTQTDTSESADESDTDGTDGDGDDGDGSGLGDLLARLGAADPSPSQVTYELSGDGFASMGDDGDGEIVVAVDPPRTAQQSVTPQGVTRVILSGDEIVTCVEPTGGAWECTLAEGVGGLLGDLVEVDPDLLAADHDPGGVTRDTIAGRDAICLTFDDSAGAGTAEVCLDEQSGVLLRSSGGVPDGSFTMEAVAYSDEPDPGLFEPPAEPQRIGRPGDPGDLDLGDLGGLDPGDLDLGDQ